MQAAGRRVPRGAPRTGRADRPAAPHARQRPARRTAGPAPQCGPSCRPGTAPPPRAGRSPCTGRHGDRLLNADYAWRVLHRDASDFLARCRAGAWYAPPGIPEFADDIARLAWTENSLRAVERAAPRVAWNAGLIQLIQHAVIVLKVVPAGDQAPLPLRQLVDVLAR